MEWLTCEELVNSTPTISLFVAESATGEFSAKVDSAIDAKNFDQNLFLSLKINRLSHNIGEQLTSMYQDVMMDHCITNANVLAQSLAFAKIDPQEWVTRELGEGFIAVRRSDIMFMEKCAAVSIQHRHTLNCYQDLPITFNEHDAFMKSQSRVITNSSEEIQCSVILPNKYKIGNSWFMRINGELMQTTAPDELDFTFKISMEVWPI